MNSTRTRPRGNVSIIRGSDSLRVRQAEDSIVRVVEWLNRRIYFESSNGVMPVKWLNRRMPVGSSNGDNARLMVELLTACRVVEWLNR